MTCHRSDVHVILGGRKNGGSRAGRVAASTLAEAAVKNGRSVETTQDGPAAVITHPGNQVPKKSLAPAAARFGRGTLRGRPPPADPLWANGSAGSPGRGSRPRRQAPSPSAGRIMGCRCTPHRSSAQDALGPSLCLPSAVPCTVPVSAATARRSSLGNAGVCGQSDRTRIAS